MDIKIDKNYNPDGEIVVYISGEIDVFTAPKLREELSSLAEGPNKSLTVSLKDVSYIDSTGLGVFVGLYKQIKKNNGELKLIELSGRSKRLFNITGLSDIINISCNS